MFTIEFVVFDTILVFNMNRLIEKKSVINKYFFTSSENDFRYSSPDFKSANLLMGV